MNKLRCLIIMFSICKTCAAQNLVPNGDFEQYSSCPGYWGQLDSALFWINPDLATPDYFNHCATFSNAGVPQNGMGARSAHSGVAYSGISLYDLAGNNTREYIETVLTSPLIANAHYYFEMYASIGEYSIYTTDAIQVYFSDTLIANVNSTSVLPYSAQISNTSGVFINVSTSPWSLISGDYLAHGGENYLIIGNFKDNASTALQVSGAVFNAAYSYIDDVSLTITTGINTPTENDGINIFPTPFEDKLCFTTNNNEPSEIILYDSLSRIIMQKQFTNAVSLNTDPFAKGIYFYELRNKKGVIKKGITVKN